MKNLLAKRVKKNNKGFTLVELIIVIAIIAILIAVLAPNYVRYVDRSRWSSDRNDCESLLQEVRTAIVDTQNEDKTVSPCTITVSAGGTFVTAGTLSADMKNSLFDADKAWSDGKIKHKNKQVMPGDSDAKKKKYDKFVITVTDSGASGEWQSTN